MKIHITAKSLSDPSGKNPFRSFTLSSLYALQKAGHELIIKRSDLSDLQQVLLEQEGIHVNDSGVSADISIKESSDSLMIKIDESEDLRSDWNAVADLVLNEARKVSFERNTSETKISISINLDGTGVSNISTGLEFFDHMLEQIARHGFIDLDLNCKGDLQIDEHHTIEDVAIALGQAIDKALGNKKGIERYAFVLPMDETRATVALDLSGRPYLVFDGTFKREYVGDLPTEMVKHFFYSLAMNLNATLHVSFEGENDHHKIEACFKGLARTLKAAIERNERIKNLVPSSKGTL